MSQLIKNLTLIFILVFLTGCSSNKKIVYQTSTIVELMKGHYDSQVTLKKIKANGDFGIGTINGLDGEFILIKGKFFHLRGEGKVQPAKDYLKTPYAMVTRFITKVNTPLTERQNYEQITDFLNTIIDTQNVLTAIQIDGLFSSVKFRVVPTQQPPYKPLAEVMPFQREVEVQNQEGSLIGFYIPKYMAGINTPGYHFHYISKDRKIGGHVLDCYLQEGVLSIDTKNKFFLQIIEKNNEKSNIKNKSEQVISINTEVKAEDKINEVVKKEEIEIYQKATQNIEPKPLEAAIVTQPEPEPEQIKAINEGNTIQTENPSSNIGQ